jgi:asparagine synthase (glutamine-hydrolysing)
MCGIAGAVRGDRGGFDESVLRAMLRAIRHRGPDGEGIWNENGVWFGHRRLAVIDLSAAGDQPMVSACGRYVILANGEIYNYEALRAELDAGAPIPWRGHCDIEVLLEAIARYGIEAALARANGMFAFALWDRERCEMHLARDRFGEKPLYYADQDGALTFASELTALERVPGVTGDLSREALSLYFRLGYVPAPYSIYEGVRKLPPGCLLTWQAGAPTVLSSYWTLAYQVRAGQRDRLTDPEAAIDEFDTLLRDAVKLQMVADVPLGAFLSGGVDSSLITGIMQSISDRPVKTFTVGFDSREFNEAEYALAVARHLKTDHTEHYVTAADSQAVAARLGDLFDEPFADSSQIPTYLISQIARRHVTVCLTGDAGDEMFAGYVRYPGVPRLWKTIRRLPMRGAASAVMNALPLSFIDGGLGFLGPLARQYTSRGSLSRSVRKAAPWLAASSEAALYEMTMSAWTDPDALLVDPPRCPPSWRPEAPIFDNTLEAMQWRDSVDYLPDDILCKVDRAAMANSLETRVPLLDPRIAAFAWRAPPCMKIRGGETKWLMRRVLDRYVPRELIDRPKMGFTVPLHAWLTSDLRDWAETLLDPALLKRQGVLRPEPIRKLWDAYVRGDSSGDLKVWSLLMFQSWMAARGR